MNKREVIRFSREDIDKRVKEIAKQISKDYENKELVVIGLLRGSFVFLADLVVIKIHVDIKIIKINQVKYQVENNHMNDGKSTQKINYIISFFHKKIISRKTNK